MKENTRSTKITILNTALIECSIQWSSSNHNGYASRKHLSPCLYISWPWANSSKYYMLPNMYRSWHSASIIVMSRILYSPRYFHIGTSLSDYTLMKENDFTLYIQQDLFILHVAATSIHDLHSSFHNVTHAIILLRTPLTNQVLVRSIMHHQISEQ